ncbi:MAG: helix-turn-helix domain-containing protein [Acidimicrobiia bacterium]
MTVPRPRSGTDHSLDYDLDEVVYVEDAAAMKAVADDTRMDILNLLLERAATVSQLADALGKPKGTVGYHAKILEDVGLTRVVRTAKVRAMTEKYYGRVGRTIQFRGSPRPDDPHWFVNDALRSMVAFDGDPLPMFTSRVARIPAERAVEFSERILELSEEFIDLPRSGETVFGFLAGVFPTNHPMLSDEEATGD